MRGMHGVKLLALWAAISLFGGGLVACGSDSNDRPTPTEDVMGDTGTDTVDPDADTDVGPDVTPDTDTTPDPTTAGLRVLHASFDAPAVDIWVNGEPSAITGLAFGEASGPFLELDPGTYSVAVTVAGATDVADAVFSADISLEAGKLTTAWAYGSLAQGTFGVTLLTANAPGAGAGSVDLAFSHAAANVGPVWIFANDAATPAFSNIDLGASVGPARLPAAAYVLGVALSPEGPAALVFDADLTGVSGLVQIVAVGDLSDESVGVYALAVLEDGTVLEVQPRAPGDPEEVGYLRVFHGSFDAPGVDIWVNGEPTIIGLGFGQASGAFLELPVGTYDVEITVTGAADTSDAVFAGPVTLVADAYVTAYAYGSLSGGSFGVSAFAAAAPALEANELALAFTHAAANVGPVSIVVNGGAEPVISNADLGDSAGPLVVGAADYALGVRLGAGLEEVLRFLAPLSGASGWVHAFAVGDLSGSGISLIALFEGGTTAEIQPTFPAQVRVIHAAYDAPAVDVWVNGAVAVPNFAFGFATGYLSLWPGAYDVAIAPAGAQPADAVFSTTLTLTSGLTASAIAIGSLGAGSFTVAVAAEDVSAAAAGGAALAFTHGASNVPAVWINALDTDIFADVSFGGSAARVDLSDVLSAGTLVSAFVRLSAVMSDPALTFDLPTAAIEDQVVRAVAVGDLGDTAFGVQLLAVFGEGEGVLIAPTQPPLR